MRKCKVFFLVCTLLLTSLLLPACGGGTVTSTLTAAFLKVGKADAVVLTGGTGALVIDTGESDDGSEVLQYLKDRNVTAVDALIITHYDQDHVGGAAALLSGIEVKRVITPAYTGSNAEYQSFVSALDAAGITPEALTASVTFSFGDATVLVEPPASYEIAGTADDADNELSLITTVTHGKTRLLFMGDAENDRMSEWLASGSAARCDLIKIPHHGVYHKTLKDLLAVVSPAYAVICDSEKNPAEEKTLTLLEEHNAATFETKDGDVLAVSDGKTLTVDVR